jgi:hypothetical protein
MEVIHLKSAMSALGQKQTDAPQQSMSALPPIPTAKADMPHMVASALPLKADVCSANRRVCYGPKADINWVAISLLHFLRHPSRPIPPTPGGDEWQRCPTGGGPLI